MQSEPRCQWDKRRHPLMNRGAAAVRIKGGCACTKRHVKEMWRVVGIVLILLHHHSAPSNHPCHAHKECVDADHLS